MSAAPRNIFGRTEIPQQRQCHHQQPHPDQENVIISSLDYSHFLFFGAVRDDTITHLTNRSKTAP